MKKKTITKAVILTATILVLTGCNSNTSTNPTESVTTTTVEQEVETSTEETTTTATSPNQETETSSISTEQGEETTTATTTGSDESTIPETTVEIETTTQVAGYDGICSEYGHAETINGADCFILDEGAPLAAWKDALSKYKWVSNDSYCFWTTTEYKGHTILTGEPGTGLEDVDEDAYNNSMNYLWMIGYMNEESVSSPFTYDIDLNVVCSDLDWCKDYVPEIMAQEVRDGVTWYKYDMGDGDEFWLPEHNGADWDQVYKKYVEEPYEAKQNSMSEEDKVNESLIWDEQVWNKTYYDVRTDGADSGRIYVSKQYAYKNADVSITQSAGWEACDTSIFDGTSLATVGSYGNWADGQVYWQMDGDVLYIKRGGDGEYQERASELYYHLIDLYGEECVYWNGDGNIANTSSFDGRHDWDVYGDGKDRCKTKEEHIAKCQGN